MLTKLKSDKFVSVLLFLLVSFVFFYGIIRAADGIIISNDRGTILFPSGSTPATNGEVGYNGTNFLLRTGGNNTSLSGLGPLDAAGNPLSGHVAYRNLIVQFATTSTVSITADSLTPVNPSNQSIALFNVSIVPSTASSGALGLDTGSVASDARYALWVLVKSDGSASTAVYSLSATSPTLPTGYTNAYKARVGWVFTAHTTTNILEFLQQGNRFQHLIDVGLTTSDGNRVLNAGTATSFAGVSLSSRMPTTSRKAILHIAIVASSNATSNKIDLRMTGGTNRDMSGFWNVPANAQTDNLHVEQATNSSQSIDYETQTNDSVNIYVDGYEDNL